ncbi:glycosyltransferase [Ligilactobacillus equi]|uniref:glycosyltransferase n=1 Tax=Ligilactobacillus equi TaxID=137357 RepID=UPI002ED58945
MTAIAAGVVVYNPGESPRFQTAFASVMANFERIYVFDNSSQPVKLPAGDGKIVYLTAGKNVGIARALNQIMLAAKRDGYDWVVTLDQDSVVPAKLAMVLAQNLTDTKLAIVCPQVVDYRRQYQTVVTSPASEFVERAITSGSCTSVAAWEKVGGFDEWMFIDLVDNEFCKRLILAGYRILQLNKVILDQEYGEIQAKSVTVQHFWQGIARLLGNQNFAKLGYRKAVNPVRVYYCNRNVIYVNRKFKGQGMIGYDSFGAKSYAGFWLTFNLASFLRAQDKLSVIKAIIKGRRDGRKQAVLPWHTERKRRA